MFVLETVCTGPAMLAWHKARPGQADGQALIGAGGGRDRASTNQAESHDDCSLLADLARHRHLVPAARRYPVTRQV